MQPTMISHPPVVPYGILPLSQDTVHAVAAVLEHRRWRHSFMAIYFLLAAGCILWGSGVEA